MRTRHLERTKRAFPYEGLERRAALVKAVSGKPWEGWTSTGALLPTGCPCADCVAGVPPRASHLKDPSDQYVIKLHAKHQERKVDSPDTAELKQSLGVEKGKGRGEKRPAHDEGRAQRVEELKEIEELCNKRRQEIQDPNELVNDNSLMQNLKDVCSHFNDGQQLNVLTRLLSVFQPHESVLPLLDEHGAAGILEMIVREHHLDTNVIIGMFKDLPKEVSWPDEAEDEQWPDEAEAEQ